MADIADAAQKPTDPPQPQAEDVMNAVLDGGNSTPPPQNPPPQDQSTFTKKSHKRTGPIVAILLFLLLTIPLTVYYIRQRQELRKEAEVSVASACANGGFTTASGKRYCFVVNSDIKTKPQAQLACQQYGTFASFLNGDTRQDVLDVISRFNQDKSALYQNTSGGDQDDGAYFADTCDDFTDHFEDDDDSLYEEGGSLNCSQPRLSFSRRTGKINDTGEDEGRGGVCELAARQDLCQIATVSQSSLAPGQSVTISSTAKSNVNSFSYAFYNLDNLYNPGNPKSICVASGGDVTTVPGGCPAGTHHLLFKDPDASARTIGSRTLRYEDIFVADQNNGNAVASRVQINAYFSATGGATSLPNTACVVSISAVAATPTNTPTHTPTNTPTHTPTNTPTNAPTNTPTHTPTPTSGVGGFRPTATPTRRPTSTPTRRPSTIPTATASPTLILLPSVTPTPFSSGEPPSLIVNPFTNANREAPQTFTLTGSSSPNAQITIEISPDGIFGTATADETGAWRYILTQKLTPGTKELRVTATDINGLTTTYTETFTVKGGGLGAWIWTILGLVAAILVFIIIRRRMNQPPPYIPPTTPEAGPTTSEASPFVPEQPVAPQEPTESGSAPLS